MGTQSTRHSHIMENISVVFSLEFIFMIHKVLSFDVGYTNLAYTLAEVDYRDGSVKALLSNCVNLRCVKHDYISRDECKLMHSNETWDLFQHFLQCQKVLPPGREGTAKARGSLRGLGLRFGRARKANAELGPG